MGAGQSDATKSSFEGPSFQVTLACVELTKNNQRTHDTWRVRYKEAEILISFMHIVNSSSSTWHILGT